LVTSSDRGSVNLASTVDGGASVVNVSTGDVFELNGNETVALLASPGNETTRAQPVDLSRVVDMEGPADDQHAPPFVIDGVGSIDFQGSRRVESGGIKIAASPSTEHDGLTIDEVVDRVDGWSISPHDTDSSDTVGLKAQDALFTAKSFEMAGRSALWVIGLVGVLDSLRGAPGDGSGVHDSIVSELASIVVGTNVPRQWTLVLFWA
jgi:hypothetical protein